MNDRIPLMPRADRAARRQLIIDLAMEGNAPSVLARQFGLTTDHVRQIILEAGVRQANPLSVGREASAMWEMDEDARRQAFIRRAAKGARETLEKMPRVKPNPLLSPLSTLSTVDASVLHIDDAEARENVGLTGPL